MEAVRRTGYQTQRWRPITWIEVAFVAREAKQNVWLQVFAAEDAICWDLLAVIDAIAFPADGFHICLEAALSNYAVQTCRTWKRATFPCTNQAASCEDFVILSNVANAKCENWGCQAERCYLFSMQLCDSSSLAIQYSAPCSRKQEQSVGSQRSRFVAALFKVTTLKCFSFFFFFVNNKCQICYSISQIDYPVVIHIMAFSHWQFELYKRLSCAVVEVFGVFFLYSSGTVLWHHLSLHPTISQWGILNLLLHIWLLLVTHRVSTGHKSPKKTLYKKGLFSLKVHF